MPVTLKKNFDKRNFNAGASIFKCSCWYLISLLCFRSGFIPFSNVLVALLRLFGAEIGREVRIKPYIHIKYPWRLEVGDYSWLGDCYIENLAKITIGKHVCISQRAMLLSGSHDYRSVTFDLITKPIVIEEGVWICANSTVMPGVRAGAGSILLGGSVATCDLAPSTIYQGNPAGPKRKRY